ncbi:MAG: NAD(P)H-hydrate dehydratase [Planctomycetota bacterium]|nr:NAD(P)H-hydrate dehydratase [Planctomycetota bacterium]MEC8513074.1 NAD(P)H-hydrate dehydratase [Planctomycetota bacterium]
MQNARSLPVLSTEAMRAADRATIEELGVPGFTLMETAARGALAELEEWAGPSEELSVLVLAGKGNNGGDGLALARMLAIRGARVLVLSTASAADGTEDARRNLALLERLEDDELCWLDLEHVPATADRGELGRLVADWVDGAGDRALVAVDALLGIGASGPLRAPVDVLAELSDAFEAVVSLDVPTGLDSDSGLPHDERAVVASLTVCLGALKAGLVLGDGPEYAGEVSVVDIGIPPTVLAESAGAEGSGWLIGDASVAGLLPERPRGAHKFSVGQLAVVAGSDAYSGAAVLASRAAGRVGAGYVIAFSSAAACAAIDAQAPEVCTVPIPTDHEAAAALVRARGDRASALLLGPGLESTEASDALVRELLATVEGPAVIDAGALSALAPWIEDGELKERAGERWVLTPHPGELARLTGSDSDLEDAGAIERGRALAARWGCVLVLKGAPTLVCDPAGAVFLAGDAPTSLATAGSGDVLTGTIGGLLAQGLDPLDAALAAVHLGLGAARALEASGAGAGLLAGEIADALPGVLLALGVE